MLCLGRTPLRRLEAALLRVAVNPPATLLDQLKQDERGLPARRQACATRRPHSYEWDSARSGPIRGSVYTGPARRAQSLPAKPVRSSRGPSSPVMVIATLRADFYDRPLLYHNSGELLQRRTEVILPLSLDELERAIVQPAARLGIGLEPDLLSAIIDDVNKQPGALPLLQYALTEVFGQRVGNLMTLAGYLEIGGVAGLYRGEPKRSTRALTLRRNWRHSNSSCAW